MTLSPAVATVIGAFLGAASAIVVALITIRAQNKRLVEQMNQQTQQFLTQLREQNTLIVYRLEQLENKVNAHNNYDRRIVALEEQVKTLFKHGGDAA